MDTSNEVINMQMSSRLNTKPIESKLYLKLEIENLKQEKLDIDEINLKEEPNHSCVSSPLRDTDSLKDEKLPVELIIKEERNSDFVTRDCSALLTSLTQTNILKIPKIRKKKYTSDRFYPCDQCMYAAKWPRDLKRHVLIHTGEKPYACDQCAFVCNTASYLKMHKRSHSGLRPFSCTTCPRAFYKLRDLKNHIYTHTGERPYACHLCDYVCILPKTLKIHKLTHTGEKPFSCDECSYRCSTSGGLKRHKKVHSV